MGQELPINIIGGAYEGRSRNDIQELINMYVEFDNVGGRDPVELRGTPGLVSWFENGTGEVRGFDIFAGELWVVIGDTLYLISGPSGTGGTATSKGTLDTSAGQVQIFNNGTDLAVCDGTDIYSQTGVALTKQRTATYMAYQDGYFVIIVPDSGSALASADPTSWGSAPDIAAEGSPDFLVSAISDHRELILLGEDSIEVFYTAPSATLPFQRVSGGYIEIGCGAANSVVKVNNQVYFLDDNNHIRRLSGLQTEILSTPAISAQISNLEDTHEAFGFTYSIDGHIVYVITFDQSNVTYCFDTTTSIWYKWSTDGYNNRHTSNCFVRYNGLNLVGDKESGTIYTLDPTAKKDGTLNIYRERTTQYISNHPDHTHFERLILEIQTATVPGSEPKVMLSHSDNYGNTYSAERIASLGASGQYTLPVEFYALGSAKDRVFRIRITDDCFVSIQNAVLIGGIGWY